MQETQETRVQFLGGEDPLEEDMATHASILAWKIPWTEEPGGLQSTGSVAESDTTEPLRLSLSSSFMLPTFLVEGGSTNLHFIFAVVVHP